MVLFFTLTLLYANQNPTLANAEMNLTFLVILPPFSDVKLLVKLNNKILLTAPFKSSNKTEVLVLSHCSFCFLKRGVSPTWTLLVYLHRQKKTVVASKTHKPDQQMCKDTAQKHFSHQTSQQRHRDNRFGRALWPPGQLWQATCGPALLLV